MSHQTNSDTQTEDQELRRMLIEDTDSPDEAEILLSTVKQIRHWHTPDATPQDTASLVKLLTAEMPTPKQSRLRHWMGSWPLLLIRSQIRIVRTEIWIASALVIVLGTAVTLTSSSAVSGGMLPLALLAPLVAAVGVALLYDTDTENMLELEETTPVSIRLLLLARLTLVFGFDLILGLVGSLTLAALRTDLSLWPMVMSWLAPMAFLSALAFLLSVAFVDSMVGTLFSMGLWAMHVLLSVSRPDNTLFFALSLPGLAAPEARPLLFSVAAGLIVVALWLAGRSERNIGETL